MLCYHLAAKRSKARTRSICGIFPKKELFQITSNVSGLNMVQWPLVGVVELELELELVGASDGGLS